MSHFSESVDDQVHDVSGFATSREISTRASSLNSRKNTHALSRLFSDEDHHWARLDSQSDRIFSTSIVNVNVLQRDFQDGLQFSDAASLGKYLDVSPKQRFSVTLSM